MPMPQTDSRQIYGGKRREERLGGGKKWRRDHRLMVFPAFLCPPPSFCNSCSVLESEKNKQTQIERMVQKLVSKCRRFHCCTAVNSNRPSIRPVAHYDRMPKMQFWLFSLNHFHTLPLSLPLARGRGLGGITAFDVGKVGENGQSCLPVTFRIA